MEQVGPYKIVRQLATEGTSQLYEAIQDQTQRRAAIKILDSSMQNDPGAVKRFLNQARAVNLIGHPNIVNIYEYGQLPSGAPYVVMEWLYGETLRDRMRRLGRAMEPVQAMRVARTIASALAAAHDKQVVHRDLKPGSVMLIPDADTPEGERVKVLDFSIAKVTTTNTNTQLTQTGQSLGTPTYMSPEQTLNAADVTDRSDVYSLGILLYEMLAGAPPFSDAEGATGVMWKHLREDPPPLKNRAPEASTELAALVHRMLAKPPTGRPSASEVATLLGQLLRPGGAAVELLAPPIKKKPATPSPTFFLPPPPPDETPSLLTRLKRQPPGQLMIAGAGLLVFIGVFGMVMTLVVWSNMSHGPPPIPQVTWSIKSDPADSEILDGAGLTVGRTPWRKLQPQADGLVTLTIRRQGYGEEKLVLDRSHDEQRELTLPKLSSESASPRLILSPVSAPESAATKPAPSGIPKSSKKSKSKSRHK